MIDFVCLAIVDPHGRVLLQERDEHALEGAEQWSLPGGSLEPGEEPRGAAARELTEESELVVPAEQLTDLGRFHVELSVPLDFHAFAARADVGNEDVTCHEGRQMVFVDRAAMDGLDLAKPTRLVLPTLDAWIEETAEPPMLVGVVLVDREGRLLLQERDEHPALDPLMWGLVGGHLDADETFEAGAYRELAEETGVVLPRGTLSLFREYAVHGGRMQVFTAGCDLTDADLECHEGLQIVFVDPDSARGLDLGVAASLAVTELLDSPAYAALVGGP